MFPFNSASYSRRSLAASLTHVLPDRRHRCALVGLRSLAPTRVRVRTPRGSPGQGRPCQSLFVSSDPLRLLGEFLPRDWSSRETYRSRPRDGAGRGLQKDEISPPEGTPVRSVHEGFTVSPARRKQKVRTLLLGSARNRPSGRSRRYAPGASPTLDRLAARSLPVPIRHRGQAAVSRLWIWSVSSLMRWVSSCVSCVSRVFCSRRFISSADCC